MEGERKIKSGARFGWLGWAFLDLGALSGLAYAASVNSPTLTLLTAALYAKLLAEMP